MIPSVCESSPRVDLVLRTLARLSMESLLASYGWSLDGISNTAGMDSVWASNAVRMISATCNITNVYFNMGGGACKA